MKKLFLLLFAFLAFSALSTAQIAGCANPVNITTNGNFSGGNTGFSSSLALDPSCSAGTAGTYIVANNFNVKCPLIPWPNVFDHTLGTAAGSFLIIDGNPAGPATIWSQTVNICPNTNYTFSYWAYNIYGNSFGVDFVVGPTVLTGTVVGTSTPAASAWTEYSIVWNSGSGSGPVIISLKQQTGGSMRDFGIDDIFFGYCGTTSVNSSTICSGNCATLTASGAPSYSWSTGATTSSIVVCPTTTTSYTVTGTSPGGCLSFTPAVATVTVNPSPTVTVTATPSTLTPPSVTTSSLSATASGGSGFTYSWSPAAGLSNTTIANPVATPTSTTVYTVTVTNSNGCSASATTTVVVTPQSLCNLTYNYDITSSTTTSAFFGALTGVSAANIRINGVLTVDGNFNFSGCNIEMEPGSRIETLPGSSITLYITGGTHLFSCQGMWDGIYIQNGTSLQMMNKSVVEDAIKGVKIEQGATAQIQFCIFNRNYTAVELTANTSTTSPLDMLGCVVTSRDIPFSPSITSNPTASVVWSNIVSGAYPSINMKTPYYSYKSIYGVYATDVNALKIGTDVSADPLWDNGFDNLASTGVYLVRSNTLIYNNNFRTITNSTVCFLCTPLIGMGVYAVGAATTSYSLKVGGIGANQPNTFTNVYCSIESSNYQLNRILANTITNATTTTATYGGYGKFGIKLTPSANHTIDVRENNITNCATGIWLNRVSSASMPITSQTVDNNTLTANSSGFTTNGIYITDCATASGGSPTTSEIASNTIIEAVNCISITNVQVKLDIFSNSCMTRYATSGNSNGIKAVSSQYATIRQNHTKYNVTTAGLAGGNILSYGIYLLNSPGMYVYCNTIEDAARCMVFDGNCSSPNNIFQNTMRRAQDGIVLLSSTAVIGNQGVSGSPSNNYWDMTSYITNQVVSNSSTAHSFCVNAIPGGAAATQPTLISGSGTITLTFTATVPPACGPVPARMHEQPVMQSAPATILLSIYPNPSNGTFTIETNSTGVKDIFVYDAMGRLVFSLAQTTDASIAVDISTTPKGLYFVRLVNGDESQEARIINQ